MKGGTLKIHRHGGIKGLNSQLLFQPAHSCDRLAVEPMTGVLILQSVWPISTIADVAGTVPAYRS